MSDHLTQQNRCGLTRDDFIGALRTALMQLDDLPALRQNALLPLLASDPSEATPSGLQRTLLTLIDALRDESDACVRAGGVAAHDVLYYRYVEQLAQADLAFQLGVSVRQLRRYQNSAIERLADLLCQRYQIALADGPAQGMGQGLEPGMEQSPAAKTGEADDPTPQSQDHVHDEVASLRRGDPAAACDLHHELGRALTEARVIADHYAIAVEATLPDDLPSLALPPTLLRQVLLTLLTALLPHVRSLAVRAQEQGQRVVVALEGAPAEHPTRRSDLLRVVEATTQLLAQCGGEVRALERTDSLRIFLTVPARSSRGTDSDAATVLVVDDNHDTRYLFRRYAAQTRYTLFDTDDVTQVIPLASRHRVDAIILDVMMPATDGWELLAQLRHHPATQNIPVIICTILPQQDLAYHLGVAGFMQKPISRPAFLATLAHVLAGRAKMPNPLP